MNRRQTVLRSEESQNEQIFNAKSLCLLSEYLHHEPATDLQHLRFFALWLRVEQNHQPNTSALVYNLQRGKRSMIIPYHSANVWVSPSL